VLQGSVLDADFLTKMQPGFDIVYSWGVLHHTGSMWQAVENAGTLVKPGGKLWIALYVKGPKYEEDLALKKRYNASSWFGKKCMEWKIILHYMQRRLAHRANPFK
jgi:2-polyprenyl-6-hydroxyphenyl methylase/3-demethylubiquinone-9 3-methyltransferase